MPIPDAEKAVVTPAKVRDYLLNPLHPDGGSKATWFHQLGYRRDRWQELVDDLLRIARGCENFDADSSMYGIKYRAWGRIGRPGARPGGVMTVWICEADEPPRLVTAYPMDLP